MGSGHSDWRSLQDQITANLAGTTAAINGLQAQIKQVTLTLEGELKTVLEKMVHLEVYVHTNLPAISPTGYTGYTGASGGGSGSGATGYTGPIGYTGYTGYTGDTGAQGPTGYTGYTGAIGPTGYTGYTGSAGSATPGGASGNIQYNNGAGGLGGLSSFYINPVNGEVVIIDTASASSNSAALSVQGDAQEDDIQDWYTSGGTIGSGPDACYIQSDGTFVAIVGLRNIGTYLDATDSPGTPGQLLSSTGTGTQWIPSIGGLLTTATFTLNASQLEAAVTTPQLLIAAVSGKILVPFAALFEFVPNTTPFTVAGSQVFGIQIGGTLAVDPTNWEISFTTQGILDQTVKTASMASSPFVNPTPVTSLSGLGLYFGPQFSGDTVSGGDGSLVITLMYLTFTAA